MRDPKGNVRFSSKCGCLKSSLKNSQETPYFWFVSFIQTSKRPIKFRRLLTLPKQISFTPSFFSKANCGSFMFLGVLFIQKLFQNFLVLLILDKNVYNILRDILILHQSWL